MSQKNKLKKQRRRETRMQREKQKKIKKTAVFIDPTMSAKNEILEQQKEKSGGLIEVKVPNLFDIMNDILVTPVEVKKLTEVENPVMGKKYGEVYKVEQPESGGILVYMTGYDEPYRGLPVFNLLSKVKTAKGALKEEAFDIFESVKKLNAFGKIKLLLSFKELKILGAGFIRPLHKIIEECKFKPERYCQAVRELKRVFAMFPYPNEIIAMTSEIGLGVVELDNAYRFRIQDYSEETDKKRLFSKKERSFIFDFLNLVNYVLKGKLKGKWMSDFMSEIYKVMTLGIDKERKPGMKPKMKTIRDLICLYLLVSKKTRKWLQRIVSNVNFNELKLSKEDICFCNCRKDYKFKYKRKLGNEEGLVIEQKCRVFDKKMGEKMREIEELRKQNKEAELKEYGVYDTMKQIEIIQVGEAEIVKRRTNDIAKYENVLGDLYRQRISLLNQFLSKIESLIKGQEKIKQ